MIILARLSAVTELPSLDLWSSSKGKKWVAISSNLHSDNRERKRK
jgi:hypothetical protein